MVAVPAWSVVVPAKRLAVAKTRLRPLTDQAAHPASTITDDCRV